MKAGREYALAGRTAAAAMPDLGVDRDAYADRLLTRAHQLIAKEDQHSRDVGFVLFGLSEALRDGRTVRGH
jgi:hypothetical protein